MNRELEHMRELIREQNIELQKLISGSQGAESCMVPTQDNTIVIGKVRSSITSAHDRNTDEIVRGQEMIFFPVGTRMFILWYVQFRIIFYVGTQKE